ncbi:MAG TPA: LCP family protein [Sporichthya sp.]|nr:LCP family protein [Sporichthya sp.]
MGAHSAPGGRRRSGVHVEGPPPEGPRRGRHAGPAVRPEPEPRAGTLAATVESLAAEAVAAENEIVDALLVEPAPVLDEVIDLPPRVRRRRKTVQSVGRALRWTIAGALVPGLAHLAAGRRRIGMVMAGSFATLLLAGALLLAAVPHTRLMQVSVKTGELELVMILCIALALIWVLVVVSSWAVHKPDQMRTGQRVLATGVVVVLGMGVATPFAVGARTAYVQMDLLKSIFDNPEPPMSVSMPPGQVNRQPGFGPATGYFANKPRVNVLLLGGDGGTDRIGIRTDTMILASIDTRTGRTVLISLPRNFSQVQFPTGTEMARRFPNGFDDMMNAVYTYAENDKSVMPGAKYPGGELIKQAFAWTIAQPVDYFVLVNLDGFRDIVDAFGGVTLTVNRRLPIGGSHDANGNVIEQPHAYLEPGRRKLDGYEALWYGRSRFDSDDYARMNRQRCLLGAIAKQASPRKVLTNFSQLASAAKRIILTDIPQKALPDLLALANKAKSATITSVTFVRSASFDPANPAFSYIQDEVRLALAEATNAPSSTPDPNVSPGTKAGAKSGIGTGTKKGTKTTTEASSGVGAADSLDSVCDY